MTALYVDPTNRAAAQADAWRTTDPAGAALMDWLALRPLAVWLGEWTTNPTAAVDLAVTTAGGSLRVFVVYAIPHRDCGSLSAGGVPDAVHYRAFVAKVAAGLKGRRAVVILEPDALALTSCLSAGQLLERHALLHEAARALTAAGAAVYLDAGDSNWISAGAMAASLVAAGVHEAAGFALNVSHFEWTREAHRYAAELRTVLGSTARYVVDTSRNGLGPYTLRPGEDPRDAWCNPPGRAVGLDPTLDTYTAGCDAYLWAKAPGSSDGAINGAPPAGSWYPGYARGLVERRRPI